MDGVLIDSIASAHKARKVLLAKYGVDIDTLPDPQNENHRGSSVATLLADVKLHHDLSIDVASFASEAIDFINQDLITREITVDPDLVRFLQDLQRHDVKRAITSSGLTRSSDNKLRILGIRDYFDLIVSGDDVQEHKPSPKPYEYTADRLAIETSECIIIEDSLTGIQSGRDAGGHVIGFTKYNPDYAAFPASIPIINDWNEISYSSMIELVRL